MSAMPPTVRHAVRPHTGTIFSLRSNLDAENADGVLEKLTPARQSAPAIVEDFSGSVVARRIRDGDTEERPASLRVRVWSLADEFRAKRRVWLAEPKPAFHGLGRIWRAQVRTVPGHSEGHLLYQRAMDFHLSVCLGESRVPTFLQLSHCGRPSSNSERRK